jgi:Protein of unknown function (DUF3987)
MGVETMELKTNGPNGQDRSESSYTHVWRAHEADLPCALTGREGPDSDGQVFVEITRGDSVTFVPKDELVTFAAWKEEQARAVVKAPALMEPDRDQVEIFVEALFRYATPQGFVSLRSFYEDDARKPFRITPTSLAGGLGFLIDAAMDDARRAANAPKPVVFAPPIATFASKTGAKETDIAEGLALSVECDVTPGLARARLEAILGPATIATRSGGIWLNPQTGHAEDKLHLHWRLAEPAGGKAALARLKRARDLAARLIGADPSGKSVVHPYRWPGSWHRKAEPRLCVIERATPDAEIVLEHAHAELEAAIGEAWKDDPEATPEVGSPDDERRVEWEDAFLKLLSGAEYHPTLTPLAASFARWEMPEPAAYNVLRSLLLNSNPQNPERTRRRDAELGKLSQTVASAYAKFGKGDKNPAGVTATAEPPAAIAPVDLWPDANPPVLPEGLLPQRIETFSRAAAKVIGADVSGFAMAGLAVAAAAIPDSIQLRPMRLSPWTESARIWVAEVGDPSARKTAILNAASAALRREDRRRNQDYLSKKAFFDALAKDDQKTAHKPAPVRLILSDTSVEAAQEVYKTSTEGVLGLYDELSGWFGAMDRYAQSGHAMADRSFWLQTYNGGSYIYDRIGRGSADLPNISMTLLGGIQPDLMRKVANACFDDGLIQRLMPVMLAPSVLSTEDPEAADEMMDFDNLIPQLLALPPGGEPLRFDFGAQKIRTELEIEHHGLVRAYEGFNKKLSTAIGKQDGIFARLCLIWHCIENADQGFLPDRIPEDIAKRVAAFMREFIRPHLSDFYTGTIDLSDEHERLIAIAGYILAHKPEKLTNREVQAAVHSMRKLTSKEITPVMEQLEALGWLFRGETRRAGAPPVWTINPAVHTQYAARAKAEGRRREDLRRMIARAASVRRRENAANE